MRDMRPRDAVILGAGGVLLLRALSTGGGGCRGGDALATAASAIAAAVLIGAVFTGGGGAAGAAAVAVAAGAPAAGALAPLPPPEPPEAGGRLRGDLYSLDNKASAAARGARHVALRPAVASALAALRPLARLSRELHASALEAVGSFYARYDRALLEGERDGGRRARLATPLLLDSRAESLDALHALSLAAPDSSPLSAAADRAREAVRADTLRCLGTLERLHGGVDGELRAAPLMPPYPANMALPP